MAVALVFFLVTERKGGFPSRIERISATADRKRNLRRLGSVWGCVLAPLQTGATLVGRASLEKIPRRHWASLFFSFFLFGVRGNDPLRLSVRTCSLGTTVFFVGFAPKRWLECNFDSWKIKTQFSSFRSRKRRVQRWYSIRWLPQNVLFFHSSYTHVVWWPIFTHRNCSVSVIVLRILRIPTGWQRCLFLKKNMFGSSNRMLRRWLNERFYRTSDVSNVQAVYQQALLNLSLKGKKGKRQCHTGPSPWGRCAQRWRRRRARRRWWRTRRPAACGAARRIGSSNSSCPGRPWESNNRRDERPVRLHGAFVKYSSFFHKKTFFSSFRLIERRGSRSNC